MKAFYLLLSIFANVQAYRSFTGYCPNARNVELDGVRVIGLGHPSAAATSDQGNPNPFGVDLLNAYREVGRNPEAVWALICDLDSDGDGLPNKEELCDPTCSSAGLNPQCPDGTNLTHPGFVNSLPAPEHVIPRAYLAHGVILIITWMFIAPFGVLRSMLFKGKPSKSKPPTWFRDHKRSLYAAVLLNFVAVVIMATYVGFEPLSEAFGDIGVHRESTQGKHVIFGTFVTILSLVQPISGIFRAKGAKKGEKKTAKRFLWEIQHRWTGRITLVLALCAVVTGVEIVFKNGYGWAIAFISAWVFVAVSAIGYIIFIKMIRKEKELPTKESEQFIEQVKKSSKVSSHMQVENPIYVEEEF